MHRIALHFARNDNYIHLDQQNSALQMTMHRFEFYFDRVPDADTIVKTMQSVAELDVVSIDESLKDKETFRGTRMTQKMQVAFEYTPTYSLEIQYSYVLPQDEQNRELPPQVLEVLEEDSAIDYDIKADLFIREREETENEEGTVEEDAMDLSKPMEHQPFESFYVDDKKDDTEQKLNTDGMIKLSCLLTPKVNVIDDPLRDCLIQSFWNLGGKEKNLSVNLEPTTVFPLTQQSLFKYMEMWNKKHRVLKIRNFFWYLIISPVWVPLLAIWILLLAILFPIGMIAKLLLGSKVEESEN